jgi:AcrR family transcriptional regulator
MRIGVTMAELTSADTGPAAGGETAAEASRRKLLEAARECFARSGYPGTTTKEIAMTAGLAEKTLFRHFPTKAQLFRDAVVTPFANFIATYIGAWRERPRGARPAEVSVREFYADAMNVFDQHGRLLVALIAAQTFGGSDPDLEKELRQSLGGMLSGLDHIGEWVRANGLVLDPAITPRLMFGMVAAAGMHADWLFGTQAPPARERVIDEMTTFTVYGLKGRQDPQQAGGAED